MEQQKQTVLNKFKNIGIAILVVLLSISIIIIFSQRTSSNPKDEKKLQELRDSILIGKNEIKTLKEDQNNLQSQLQVREQVITDQKKVIAKLKKNINEKVDSIARLDDKHTFLYITDWLSKRDSIR